MSLWEPAISTQRRPQHEVLGSVQSAHRIYRPPLETHKDELLLSTCGQYLKFYTYLRLKPKIGFQAETIDPFL